MALAPISPFCFEQFHKVQGHFANWVVNHVEKSPIHGRSGWLQHLQAYDYSWPSHERDAQPVWKNGVNTRAHFKNNLRASLSCRDSVLVDVVNEIMKWGGMKPYGVDAAPKIRQALQALEAAEMAPTWNRQRVNDIAVTQRVAARTKVFEMYDPAKWVIYDSRVATALACLTDLNLKSDPNPSPNSVIRCPILQGRPNESRVVQGYPGAHTAYQASLGFLYASWLCRMIAQRLNSQQSAQWAGPDFPWSAFHVEMVLWTLGVSRF